MTTFGDTRIIVVVDQTPVHN